jgi:hypothetical protein
MRWRVRNSIARWLLPAVLALLLAGCGHVGAVRLPWERTTPPAGLSLTDLRTVSDLQTSFNQDSGKPRLILLVSPT